MDWKEVKKEYNDIIVEALSKLPIGAENEIIEIFDNQISAYRFKIVSKPNGAVFYKEGILNIYSTHESLCEGDAEQGYYFIELEDGKCLRFYYYN